MPDVTRPNPDSLLSAISRDEESRKKGSLKIFFGACAGVGKTFKMLEAAQHKRKQNIDVTIGVVETHKRLETEALTAGLSFIPKKKIDYKGVTLEEFDLDAALLRKPALILIDELAHTNAPGSRHVKRWQDIAELLQSGIDVYTTLNTQHLESLNDTVAKITGVMVRETIPDAIFNQADDVELVDLPAGELLQRLKEGKVYQEGAEKAAENFFKEGNLIALRELALRKTAQRVDSQMHQYRSLHAVSNIWQAGERLLVCIGPSPFSTQLIRRTKQLADELKAPWLAVYVETPQKNVNEAEHQALEQQLHFAESLGAETVVLQGLKASEEILRFAREKNVTKIVLGKPRHSVLRDLFFGSFIDRIIRGSGDIDIYAISGNQEKILSKSEKVESNDKDKSLSYIFTIALVLGWTAFMKRFLPGVEIVNLAMSYLLLNILVAIRYGQGPSLVSSVLSVLAFDFFFIPPYNTFAVAHTKYIITFISMFVVSLITSRLMIRLRRSAEGASARERFTLNLYALSHEMLKNYHTRDISKSVAQKLSEVIQGDIMILLGTEPDVMFLEATSNPDWKFQDNDWAVAQWVCKNGAIAGLGTQTLPSSQATFFPLSSSRGVLGVVSVRPNDDPWTISKRHFVESVVRQMALAIERAMLAEEAKESENEVKRETLISSLLSSVSHDIRTPLTSIAGAASTLLSSDGKLSAADRQTLLQTLNTESSRLNRLVENILQITKIESHHIRVRKEPYSLEEIIGSTLNRLGPVLQDRHVTTTIPANIPLVPVDDLLIEQVLANLLENALRHTPPQSPIDIVVSQREKNVLVEVMDRGPGIPVASQKRIFEKFYRLEAAGKDIQGSGLGLAICDGILKAHQGTIGVKNRDGGGSIFYFTLPL